MILAAWTLSWRAVVQLASQQRNRVAHVVHFESVVPIIRLERFDSSQQAVIAFVIIGSPIGGRFSFIDVIVRRRMVVLPIGGNVSVVSQSPSTDSPSKLYVRC